MLPYQRYQKTRLFNHQGKTSQSNLTKLLSKPFWIFDKDEHLKQAIATNKQCCFQHICGLPVKGGENAHFMTMSNYYLIP